MSHLVLIAPSDLVTIDTDNSANAGYDDPEIRALLKRAEADGDSVAIIDSGELSEADREGRYFTAGVRAAALRLRLSGHFEKGRVSGASGFGREVPALLVYDAPGGTLVDVYPHRRSGGLLITIAAFLADEL